MKISKVLLCMVLLIAACSDTQETPNGFQFKLVKKGLGDPANQNQVLVYNFTITDSNDSVWFDTYERGYPELTAVADTSRIASEDGITQMLRMLKKGDSVTFTISVKKLFREMARSPIPLGVDSTLNLNYVVAIRDIVAKDQIEDYQAKLEEEYYAFQEKHEMEQLAKDTITIDEYLSANGIDAQRLPSGMRYLITKQGDTQSATPGQTVQVNYAGYLLDGTCFDTNIKSLAQEKGIYDAVREAQIPYEPFEVVVDESSVIPGWHLALKQLGEGSKGTFFIPSTLAYGQRRMGNKIKENSILIFEIEMLAIGGPAQME